MRNVAGGEIVPWFYPVSGGAGSDGIYGQASESVYSQRAIRKSDFLKPCGVTCPQANGIEHKILA